MALLTTMALLTAAMLTMAIRITAMLAPRAAAQLTTHYSLPTTRYPPPTYHRPLREAL